jgi:DNA-directed RNA polymerase specialized sigma subunit
MSKIKRLLKDYTCYTMDNATLDMYYSSDDYTVEDIDDKLDQYFMLEKVYEVINSKLTTRERQVVCMVFGLMGEDVHSVVDVAKILRISVSAVYKTLKRVISKLREELSGYDY